MRTTTADSGGPGRGRAGRSATAVAVLGVGLAGLTGCSEPVGQEIVPATAEDLQELEDRVAELEDRMDSLEAENDADADADAGGDTEGDSSGPGTDADTEAFFGDPESYLGEQVTLTAEVTEVLATSDIGAGFRVAGEGGRAVPVLSATPSPQLDRGDVVQVTGTVTEVQRDSFEADFGLAADALFDDAGAWFDEAEGEVAVSAATIEQVRGQAGD